MTQRHIWRHAIFPLCSLENRPDLSKFPSHMCITEPRYGLTEAKLELGPKHPNFGQACSLITRFHEPGLIQAPQKNEYRSVLVTLDIDLGLHKKCLSIKALKPIPYVPMISPASHWPSRACRGLMSTTLTFGLPCQRANLQEVTPAIFQTQNLGAEREKPSEQDKYVTFPFVARTGLADPQHSKAAVGILSTDCVVSTSLGKTRGTWHQSFQKLPGLLCLPSSWSRDLKLCLGFHGRQ